MPQRIAFIFLISATLTACNFGGQIKDTIDDGIKDAKTEMNADLAYAKACFKASFSKATGKTSDSSRISKFTRLYSTITNTSEYIDSLRNQMDKLDNMDLRNNDLIQRTFVNSGTSDSVFNKVIFSYSIAIDLAIADSTKSRLKTVQETYTGESRKKFFELTAPLGVSMILYGIEFELIKDGTKSLYDF